MATTKESTDIDDVPIDPTGSTSESTCEIVLPQTNPNKLKIDDFELVNLLYISYFLSVPDSKRETLASLSKTLQSWQAWECAESERQVVDKVLSKELPADHSFASLEKRMAHRAKVTDWMRGSQSTWLTKFGVDITKPEPETVKTAEVSLAIFNRLADRYAPYGVEDNQFRVVLKLTSRVIALGESDTGQKHFISHVMYKYDSVKNALVAEIKVNSFNIELSVAEEKKGAADSVIIKYEFTDYSLNFHPEAWKKVQAGIGEDFLDKGHRILKERSLVLASGP